MALAETTHTQAEVMQPEHAPALALVNPHQLIALALERNVSIETLERLLVMRDKLKAEAAEEAFLQALAAFQAECPIIKKTKRVEVKTDKGSYYFYFAPLDEIVSQAQPYLKANGLSYTVNTEEGENSVTAHVCVYHIAGHSKTFRFCAPIDWKARMNDTQKVASAHTYAKRYAFCGAFGIITGDDDDDGGRPSHDRADKTNGPIQQPSRASASTAKSNEARTQPAKQAARQEADSHSASPAVPEGEEWETTENQKWKRGVIASATVSNSGTTRGKKWTLFSIIANGHRYGSFSETVYEAAIEAVQSSRPCWFLVERKVEKDRENLNILEIRFTE